MAHEIVSSLLSKEQVEWACTQGLRRYLIEVVRPAGYRVDTLCTDRSLEYFGPFSAFCQDHGIPPRYSIPYSHQTNGLVERANRTQDHVGPCPSPNVLLGIRPTHCGVHNEPTSNSSHRRISTLGHHTKIVPKCGCKYHLVMRSIAGHRRTLRCST